MQGMSSGSLLPRCSAGVGAGAHVTHVTLVPRPGVTMATMEPDPPPYVASGGNW
jgi:hypothetical protein